jgi:hypothetical protein
VARSYRARGYKVRADVQSSEFLHPWSIGGYVPDVIAEKGGHTTVVEVETEDSIGTKRDRGQRAAFKRWASYKPTVRHFKRIVV